MKLRLVGPVFLRVNAQVIDMVFLAHVGSGLEQWLMPAALKLRAKPGHAAIFDQEGKPGAGARLARAVVSKDARDLGTQAGGFFRADEDVDGRRRAIAPRALLAADECVEAVDLLAFQLAVSRHQGDVLRLRMAAILQAP